MKPAKNMCQAHTLGMRREESHFLFFSPSESVNNFASIQCLRAAQINSNRKLLNVFFLHVVFSTRTKQRRRRERNLFSQRVAKGKSCFIPFFIRQKQKKQLIETLFSHSIRSKSKHVLNRINKKNIIIYQ